MLGFEMIDVNVPRCGRVIPLATSPNIEGDIMDGRKVSWLVLDFEYILCRILHTSTGSCDRLSPMCRAMLFLRFKTRLVKKPD